MTLRSRLVATVAVIALLVALPGIYAVTRLRELSDIAASLRGQDAAAFVALGRLQTSLAELDRYERSYIAAPAPDLRSGVFAALRNANAQLDALEKTGYGEVAADERELVAELEESTRHIDELMTSGRAEEATAEFEGVKPSLARAQESLSPIARAIDQNSRLALVEAERISRAGGSGLLLGISASLLIALLFGIWSTRGLVRPIRRLRGAMATVADGVLVAPEDLPYEREDEIGDLSRSFRSMTQQLAELDRLKAEFISMASHDLKTPINVISGYAELLQEGIFGTLDEKQREVLASVEEQTRVLTRLVTQILDISRMEAGGFRIETTEVVLADLFDAVQRAFEALARQKEIHFSVDLAESVPASAALDPDRLRNEVLGNLLSNAFKFTPKGGSISVRVWSEQDTLRIDVADSGIGIPPDQLEHIFDKYYQVGSPARHAGSGLGLAIAREIVEAHDGTLTAESQPEAGSVFHIQIPVRHAPRAEAAEFNGRA